MYEQNYKNRFRILCKNCGKSNHKMSVCRDPITSFGLVCIRFKQKSMRDVFIHVINSFKSKINIFSKDTSQLENSSLLDDVELLFIQRRHSYSFIELLTGNFKTDDFKYIDTLAKELTKEEEEIMTSKSYNDAWLFLGNSKDKNNYELKKKRFESIQKYLIKRSESNHNYELEWGFPKGRRIINESDINCAVREFCEETSYKNNQIIVLTNIYPLREIFKGNDNILYKNVYYVAVVLDSSYIPQITDHNKEVSNIKWSGIRDSFHYLRNYHYEKKKIISSINSFVGRILESNICYSTEQTKSL